GPTTAADLGPVHPPVPYRLAPVQGAQRPADPLWRNTMTTPASTAGWQPPAGRHTSRKTFGFSAAHHLITVPEGHKCARPHGHNWAVEVELGTAELVGPGWVTDFGDLAPLGAYIDAHLDHRDLNEALPSGLEPTAENLAAFLAHWCLRHLEPHVHGRLEAVTVSEGVKASATFRPAREHR